MKFQVDVTYESNDTQKWMYSSTLEYPLHITDSLDEYKYFINTSLASNSNQSHETSSNHRGDS